MRKSLEEVTDYKSRRRLQGASSSNIKISQERGPKENFKGAAPVIEKERVSAKHDNHSAVVAI